MGILYVFLGMFVAAVGIFIAYIYYGEKPNLEMMAKKDAEIAKLKADREELELVLKKFLSLYDGDIGMDSLPVRTQVELKSTTLGHLRHARAALERIKEV